MKATSRGAATTAVPLLYLFASLLAPSTALNTPQYKGCFTSAGTMSDIGAYTFQSPGYCQQQCVNKGKAVMGTTQGSHCFCGDLLPSPGDKVPDSTCNSPCDGYDQDMCGGSNAWSVELTGYNNDYSVGNAGGSAASSSSSSSSTTPTPTAKSEPSVITHASTIIVTAPGQTQPTTTVITTTETPSSKSSTNIAGIAAGVVVGIVVLTAAAGGAWFFVRHRNRRAVEDEYRQNIAGGFNQKSASSAGSLSDSRLEPSVLMQRRQSDGSIADNQDYSRRILKVTNPDGT